MPLLPLAGHLEARRRVGSALAKGRLPHSILVSGPPGVGKQRFALWVAQVLVCPSLAEAAKAAPGEPCGECPSCRKVLGLVHPDVHWMVPIPRPKAGDPDKQVTEAAEALGEVMAERRDNPLWAAPDGMAIHGVASARLILRRVALTSVEGGKKIVIIGDAERLVPQESSPEAANALLKGIEEPPGDTVFLLTASDPARLLPTIRSRTVPLRLGRLSDDEVRRFLERHGGHGGHGGQEGQKGRKREALEIMVRAAEGSIGRALAEDAAAAKARESARGLLELIEGGGRRWVERALGQTPWQARGEFSALLTALGSLLEERAQAASQTETAEGRKGGDLTALVGAIERVEESREAAQGNVNPQLLLSVLAEDLEERLCG